MYWDTLSEEERALIEDMPKDEELLLIEQIQLFSVRERRIMTAINKYRNSDSPVALSFNQRSERKGHLIATRTKRNMPEGSPRKSKQERDFRETSIPLLLRQRTKTRSLRGWNQNCRMCSRRKPKQ